MPKPALSIVVVIHNMHREAPRTAFSLSEEYQVGVAPEDYEVIFLDNGSAEPLASDMIDQFGDNIRYHYIADAQPSPAAAINFGIRQSSAPNVGIMIDGARLASPGVVRLALHILQQFARPIIGTIALHLGPDIQTKSTMTGYTAKIEDNLLHNIDWRNNGYKLFDISALAGSSQSAGIDRIAESNLIFLPRLLFDDLGGFDERFDLAGGGLVNLDFYRRACDLPDTTLITLLGEATFHQVHGGIMTNRPAPDVENEIRIYMRQYHNIHGVPFAPSTRMPLLLGYPIPETRPGIVKASELIVRHFANKAPNNSIALPRQRESEMVPERHIVDSQQRKMS